MNITAKKKIIFIIIPIMAVTLGTIYALNGLKHEGNLTSALTIPNPNNNNAGLGTGTLYVYTDPQRTTEAPTDASGKYFVLYGTLYYFRISGIQEYSQGQIIEIWAHYEEASELIGSFTVGPAGTVDFEWRIPTNLPYETEIKYKYGLNPEGPNPNWYFARRSTQGIGLTMVIPQVPLGVLGAALAILAAYSIKALTRKSQF